MRSCFGVGYHLFLDVYLDFIFSRQSCTTYRANKIDLGLIVDCNTSDRLTKDGINSGWAGGLVRRTDRQPTPRESSTNGTVMQEVYQRTRNGDRHLSMQGQEAAEGFVALSRNLVEACPIFRACNRNSVLGPEGASRSIPIWTPAVILT